MYYPNSIEEISYDKEHIEKVLTEIRVNFSDYFHEFISTEQGQSPSDDKFSELASKFKIVVNEKKKNSIGKDVVLQRIIDESISDFEKDRKKYLEILDVEFLSEYDRNPTPFHKKVLRDECPIIRYTIQNKAAKELDKYRYEFSIADSGHLLKVVTNLTNFANEYSRNIYKSELYDKVNNPSDLKLDSLNSEDYTAYGVIGGGIKSHFLYKLFPNIFPNRSREAIWALWYLTSKKSFDCKQDSEFLMISTKENITQQNFFYPYDLFVYYGIKILNFIRKESAKLNISISNDYQFVILDFFFSYISKKHQSEINELKQKIKDDGYY